MKIQNIIRIQAVVIGFAGALLLGSAAPAQEITNTEWPDSASATTSTQAAAAPAANDLNSAAVNTGAVAAAATIAKAAVSQEAAVSQWPAVGSLAIASLLVFLAMIAWYTRAAARHANRNLGTRVRQVNDRVALS